MEGIVVVGCNQGLLPKRIIDIISETSGCSVEFNDSLYTSSYYAGQNVVNILPPPQSKRRAAKGRRV